MHEAYPAVTGNPGFSLRKREALHKADHLIAISGATRDDIVHYFGISPERISVVHLAADEFFFEDECSVEVGNARLSDFGITRPYFLYVGNRGNYKNFFTLLHAFQMSNLAGDVELVAVGGEPELRHSENEFVVKHRLETSVRLLPKVSDEVLRDLYRGALAFVYPSLKEGFGIPILEAMAAGCPVAASDIPVFREIGVDPTLVFDPHSEEQLCDVLIRCSSATHERAKWISEGRKTSRLFSWQDTANRIAEVYRSHV
jgi:glycosyltransferase involved in cell wall biosynthesis